MTNLTKKLLKLSKTDPDVAEVLNVFREIDVIYNESLAAMGTSSKAEPEVINSSNVTLSFKSTNSISSE